MRGTQGVCHMLSDIARARTVPLSRMEAVEWAVAIALEIARFDPPPDLDPTAAMANYLRAHRVHYSRERVPLPGTPCHVCVASQIVPRRVIDGVGELAPLLRLESLQAFLWASRIGTIVLSHQVVDQAKGPRDALYALLMSEYASSRVPGRDITCGFGESD